MKGIIITGLAVAAVVGTLEASSRNGGLERGGKPIASTGGAVETVTAYAGRLWTVATDASGVTEVRSVAPKPTGDLHVPAKLGTTEVTRIGERAFFGCDKLESVWISEGISEIGKEAFSSCENLKCVRIPDSVRKIGAGAFFCSGLTSAMIPSGVESIGYGAFSGCENLVKISVEQGSSKYRMEDGFLIGSDRSLIAFERHGNPETVAPPEGVVRIENYAFCGIRSLKVVELKSDLSRIECDAFKDCAGITNIVVKGESVDVATGELKGEPVNAFDAAVMKWLPKAAGSGNGYVKLPQGNYDASGAK